MRVLYLGVWKDGTGWGRAALDYILALDAAGIDVVPRAVKLNDRRTPIPKRVEELEKKSPRGCDVVIQHLLPHQFEYGDFRKNIGMYASETDSFPMTNWAECVNMMDEAWVFNEQQVVAADNSGVTVPCRIVPHATDIRRFQRKHEPLPQIVEKTEGNFVFYTIGEMLNKRKNLTALLRAFHSEFHPSEPVSLVIKATGPGMSPDETRGRVKEICQVVKQGMKLFARPELYHQEIVVTENLSDADILRLHATGDCFVLPSYGEAWGIPAFDAMAMGKAPIVTNYGGFREYVNHKTGWLLSYRMEQVFGVTETFGDLHTSREHWAAPSITDLRRCMREAFENRDLLLRKGEAGKEQAYKFSHSAVGAIMKALLDERPLA
jgi:glycosyltransferase involved in cell wall biosynthesis